ncbi:hypothetical protein Pst134EA_011473 [Puccinia striiformis f. sp. tritici]|uniref:hypothetical protein n=1 Tax=Puccinia striiformis f. sp. tritici TaxID=168172 RepID=UPI0020082782|nr:hypothetical protein Pst134EA_011473 [Puccinia striiformis f. sp. tritici]KAH9456251.1 hypothetical protein Pst134EB_012455 [Puccinia striiformis f. sp. tritici]KAH9467854.1 hypothetical protein Pst134EA_011473 [Puccinia striiformis f. sp. tritici]
MLAPTSSDFSSSAWPRSFLSSFLWNFWAPLLSKLPSFCRSIFRVFFGIFFNWENNLLNLANSLDLRRASAVQQAPKGRLLSYTELPGNEDQQEGLAEKTSN